MVADVNRTLWGWYGYFQDPASSKVAGKFDVARQPKGDGIRLAGNTTAFDNDGHIVCVGILGGSFEWRQNGFHVAQATKIDRTFFFIDDKPA